MLIDFLTGYQHGAVISVDLQGIEPLTKYQVPEEDTAGFNLYNKRHHAHIVIGCYLLMTYWSTDRLTMSPFTIFASLLCKTNRFHVAMGLFRNRSQRHQNVVRISVTLSTVPCVPYFVLTTF